MEDMEINNQKLEWVNEYIYPGQLTGTGKNNQTAEVDRRSVLDGHHP